MHITVIGGGLAGLACTMELAHHSVRVTLLEAADRFGGQVRTTRDEGFVVEDGAVVLDPESSVGTDLAHELGMADQLVGRKPLPTLTLLNGRLDRLQAGETAALFGVPADQSGETPPVTVRKGMDRLVRAITHQLDERADLRSGCSAVALGKADESWMVHPEIGGAIESDALVLALPPRAAAWLVHPVDRRSARALTGLPARTVLTVTLAYHRDAVADPLDACGFIVPTGSSGAGLHSCSFATSQFDDRAPEDVVLLRAVVQPGRGELAGTTEADWIESVADLLTPILGIDGSPLASWVARWPEALPEYGPAYTRTVAAARGALAALGRVEIAGAAYDGWGIDRALVSGRTAAHRLLEHRAGR